MTTENLVRLAALLDPDQGLYRRQVDRLRLLGRLDQEWCSRVSLILPDPSAGEDQARSTLLVPVGLLRKERWPDLTVSTPTTQVPTPGHGDIETVTAELLTIEIGRRVRVDQPELWSPHVAAAAQVSLHGMLQLLLPQLRTVAGEDRAKGRLALDEIRARLDALGALDGRTMEEITSAYLARQLLRTGTIEAVAEQFIDRTLALAEVHGVSADHLELVARWTDSSNRRRQSTHGATSWRAKLAIRIGTLIDRLLSALSLGATPVAVPAYSASLASSYYLTVEADDDVQVTRASWESDREHRITRHPTAATRDPVIASSWRVDHAADNCMIELQPRRSYIQLAPLALYGASALLLGVLSHNTAIWTTTIGAKGTIPASSASITAILLAFPTAAITITSRTQSELSSFLTRGQRVLNGMGAVFQTGAALAMLAFSGEQRAVAQFVLGAGSLATGFVALMSLGSLALPRFADREARLTTVARAQRSVSHRRRLQKVCGLIYLGLSIGLLDAWYFILRDDNQDRLKDLDAAKALRSDAFDISHTGRFVHWCWGAGLGGARSLLLLGLLGGCWAVLVHATKRIGEEGREGPAT